MKTEFHGLNETYFFALNDFKTLIHFVDLLPQCKFNVKYF